MSSTVDVNVLVYASNTADPAHAAARSLVERLARGPELVYLFWPVVFGYLRVVTHPSILPRPIAPERARTNVAALLSRAHVRAPGEADGFWDAFVANGGWARGNDIPDAHLATLMRQHGVSTIHTRDRGFRRFDGIRVEDPFAATP